MVGRWVWIVVGTSVVATSICLVLLLSGRNSGGDPIARAKTAYQQKEWGKAASGARSILKTQPADPEGLRLLARATARQGKDESAEALYRRLGADAMQAEDFLLLAKGLLRRGQKGPAQAVLAEARLSAPDNPEILEAVLEHQTENQALLDATDAAERLMSKPGWEVRGMLALARLRHLLLEPAAATLLIRQALARDPALAECATPIHDVRRLLATCLLETGQPAEARRELESLLAAAPGPDPESTWLLSRALLMDGKLPEARAALQKAQEQRASDPLRFEPARFVGASKCERCHPREFKAQQQSSHARTLIHGSELQHFPWPESPITEETRAHVTHTFARTDQGIELRTTVGKSEFSSLLEYAMGSGHQGRTFVGRDRTGQARELRISQYPSEPIWTRTIEHPVAPIVPLEFVGRPLGNEPVRKCVHCHSTNFQAILHPEGRPEAADHGIGCERCHGPGEHHLKAVAVNFPELAIARPKIAPPDQVVALCAQCHTAPSATGSSKPIAVRFQGPTFVQSRCYTESGSLSCVSCHNPHRNAGRKASEYEAICLQCHAAPNSQNGQPTAGAAGKHWAPCPVRPGGDCLSCHMPRLSDAVPRAVFTDHFIRVRKTPRPG